MLTSTDRIAACEARFDAAAAELRRLAYLFGPEVDELERAARVLAVEMGRYGWVRAAARYRADDVVALVDYEVQRTAGVGS